MHIHDIVTILAKLLCHINISHDVVLGCKQDVSFDMKSEKLNHFINLNYQTLLCIKLYKFNGILLHEHDNILRMSENTCTLSIEVIAYTERQPLLQMRAM